MLIALMPAGPAYTFNGRRVGDVSLAEPVDIVDFALRLIGSSVAGSASDAAHVIGWRIDEPLVALVIGGLLAGAASYFIVSTVASKQPNGAMLGAAILCAFAGGTALMISLVRHTGGAQFALSSRYTLVSGFLLATLAVPLMVTLQRMPRRGASVLLASLALCAMLAPLGGVRVTQQALSVRRYMTSAEVAAIMGVNDHAWRGLYGIFVPIEQVHAMVARLREDKTWMFGPTWSTRFGNRVDATGVTTACEGSLNAPLRKPANGAYETIGGTVAPEVARHGRELIILDSTGVAAGYGLVLRRSLATIIGAPQAPLEWTGYLRTTPHAPQTYQVFLAQPDGGLFCRFAQTLRD